MARADLLISLIRSGATGDRAKFQRAAEALIAEEQAKKHNVLARQLTEALRSGPTAPRSTSVANGGGRVQPVDLVHEEDPIRQLSDLVLPSTLRRQCEQLIEEHHRRDLLRSFGVEPRHRILLVGPPGSGKTSLTEALANALMVPLLSVRYDSVVASYLGETSTRVASLFEHARTQACVLFFDEFETLGKERGDIHETGEIKRVVSSLLLEIDHLPSYVVVVAATNHPELLDRAVWRRMELRLTLPQTTRASRTHWLECWMSRTGMELGLSPRTVADRLGRVSFAELQDFADQVHRRLILDGPSADAGTVTAQHLRDWQERAQARS